MATRDLAKYLEDDGLSYPLPASAFTVEAGAEPRFPDGKTYRVPSPDAKTGLWLTALVDLGVAVTAGQDVTDKARARLTLDDDDERSLYQRVLGPVYDEMLADGVKWTVLQHVGQDAYLCFVMDENAADSALERLGEGPARANRAARRTARKKAGSSSKKASGGTRGRTRGPASTPSSTSPTGSEAVEAV